ncbi:MAG: hypothetical protein WC458_00635 [Patescibacteria group bacterium]
MITGSLILLFLTVVISMIIVLGATYIIGRFNKKVDRQIKFELSWSNVQILLDDIKSMVKWIFRRRYILFRKKKIEKILFRKKRTIIKIFLHRVTRRLKRRQLKN